MSSNSKSSANLTFEEKADGTIKIGDISIDASLLTEDIKAILRQPLTNNWVADSSLTPALSALSGTTYEALLENIQKVDARDIINLIQEAFLAAAGGTKPLSAGAAARPPVSARSTVFAKDEGRSWNTTALALFGHILVATKANARASELFATKYKSSDIWDMEARNLAKDSKEDSDVFIKVQMAKRFPKNSGQFALITAATQAKVMSIVSGLIPPAALGASSSSSAAGSPTKPHVRSGTNSFTVSGSK